MRGLIWTVVLVSLLAGCAKSESAAKSITLATTTSTRDSGLLDVLVPMFEVESGIQVKVVAVGSGQALEMGRRGDVDVLLTHAPEAEVEFVEQGFGIDRQAVMHNDFVLVGPASDPADVKQTDSIVQAFQRISQCGAEFISRGDNSGTHMKEQKLWTQAQVDLAGDWYLDAGAGMAATLRVASEKQAYALCDRGTFLAHRDNLRLEILSQGDSLLQNDYSVTLISPTRHPHVHAVEAAQFASFLLTEQAQATIASFGTENFGQPLFFPDGR